MPQVTDLLRHSVRLQSSCLVSWLCGRICVHLFSQLGEWKFAISVTASLLECKLCIPPDH